MKGITRKFWTTLLTAAMTASVLAGCGSSGGDTATNTAATEATETASTEAATEAAAETTAISSAGTGSQTTDATTTAANTDSVVRDVINIGIQSDPSDFAPWAANSNGRTNALWGIYQEFASIIDGEFVPVIAKSYEMGDDGLSMNVEIFDYVTDSAGNHVTASDVVFSFEKGLELGFLTGMGFIDSIEAVDDTHVLFTFNTSLRLGDMDTIFRTFIVSQAAYEADPNGMSSEPIGTGPYVLTSYTAGSSFTYTARDDYWQTDPEYIGARDMANAKTINYFILAESSQRTMALQQGTIDMCSEVSNEDIDNFREGGQYADSYWTCGVPDNLSLLLFSNCDSSRQTGDVNLRKAIFYAVNADTILESVWKGNGSTVHSMSPSWSTGYVASMDDEDNYYNYNPDTAKEYLEQSNYDGSKLVILTEATGNVANAAQLVQAFLLQVGIDSEIKTVDSTILKATYSDPSEWDILLTQFATNTYSVTSFANVFDNDRYTTGTINHVYDDQLQELINTAYSVDTATDEALLALHDYVVDNAYGMNLVNYTTTFVVPKAMDTLCLSYKKTIIPGGCIYNE